MCALLILNILLKNLRSWSILLNFFFFFEKTIIKYLINGEYTKKNFEKGNKAKPMSFKGFRHPLIFIKVGIPLKKKRFC